MGQYSISASGVMRRQAVSYADELRPLDGVDAADADEPGLQLIADGVGQ